jgi:hypothetical protein
MNLGGDLSFVEDQVLFFRVHFRIPDSRLTPAGDSVPGSRTFHRAAAPLLLPVFLFSHLARVTVKRARRRA